MTRFYRTSNGHRKKVLPDMRCAETGFDCRVPDCPKVEIENFNRKRMKPHETVSKAWHGNEHDLRSISVPKVAAAGPRQRDGLRGSGRGRSHRAVARQSHIVVPLA